MFKKFYGLLFIVILVMSCMGGVSATQDKKGFIHCDNEFKSDFSFIPYRWSDTNRVNNVVIPNYNADVKNLKYIVKYNIDLGNNRFINGDLTYWNEDLGDFRHVPRGIVYEMTYYKSKLDDYWHVIDDFQHAGLF
jgi:hypothetical protein